MHWLRAYGVYLRCTPKAAFGRQPSAEGALRAPKVCIFRIQGVTTGGLRTEVIPSCPPKQTFPTQVTKYCRPMRNKKNSITPSGGNPWYLVVVIVFVSGFLLSSDLGLPHSREKFLPTINPNSKVGAFVSILINPTYKRWFFDPIFMSGCLLVK